MASSRAGAHRLLQRFPNRVQIEWLPAYAPDLNPVEQVWNRTKYTDLANYIVVPEKALIFFRHSNRGRFAGA